MKCSNLVLAVVLAFGFGSVQAVNLNPDGIGNPLVLPPTKRVVDQPNAILNALKQNDFAALLEASERDKDIAELAKQWDDGVARQIELRAKRAQDPVDQAVESLDQDETQQQWNKLQSAAGVDALVDELQPKIAEAVSTQMLTFNMGFAAMLTSIANEKDLNAQQVQQLTQLMYAVQNWTGRVDFADRERLRTALTAVSRLVRQTKLKRFEDTQVLPFEDAIAHGDAMIATVKQVFAAYEVDVDQILNSVRLTEVDAYGDKATLHAEARVFGVDLSHEFKMQWFEGEWAGAEYVEMRKRVSEDATDDAVSAAEDAATAAAKAAAPAPKNASGGCGASAEFDFDTDTDAPAK